MPYTIRKLFGMEIQTTDVYPVDVIGIDNGRFVALFWQGAEIARIYPAPNISVQRIGGTDGELCTIHKTYYYGAECPFCAANR